MNKTLVLSHGTSMPYMNPLETEKEIEAYKEWLETKSTHYLKCLLHIFVIDQSSRNPVYVNLALRMELLGLEMNKRQISKS